MRWPVCGWAMASVLTRNCWKGWSAAFSHGMFLPWHRQAGIQALKETEYVEEGRQIVFRESHG